MSAIHGIDDMYAMPAARFFTFARRLSAYPGVMQARAIEAQAADPEEAPATRQPAARREGYESAPKLQDGQRVMSFRESAAQLGGGGKFPPVFRHLTKTRKGVADNG